MLTQAQILSMLQLQDQMNSTVNPNWRTAGYAWHRAIMVEAVECIEHHGWKWWKKQEIDMPAVQMELVDIWHFMLSMMMETESLLTLQPASECDVLCAEGIERVIKNQTGYEDYNLLQALDEIVAQSANLHLPSLSLFGKCLELTGMSWDDLYLKYIGKNALNRFRQEHGYKAGTYIKDWSACQLVYPIKSDRVLEDNDHLDDILQVCANQSEDMQNKNLFDVVMTELGLRYMDVNSAEANLKDGEGQNLALPLVGRFASVIALIGFVSCFFAASLFYFVSDETWHVYHGIQIMFGGMILGLVSSFIASAFTNPQKTAKSEK